MIYVCDSDMYHCCNDCAKSLAIPYDKECPRRKCGCKNNRKEYNRNSDVFIKK